MRGGEGEEREGGERTEELEWRGKGFSNDIVDQGVLYTRTHARMHTRTHNTCSEHRSRCYLLHVLEELRLGGPRVPTHQNVDVTSHPVLATRVLWFTTKEGKGNGTLNVFMAIYGRSNRGKNLEKEMERACLAGKASPTSPKEHYLYLAAPPTL